MTTSIPLLDKIMATGHFVTIMTDKLYTKKVEFENNNLYRHEYYVDSYGKKNGSYISYNNITNRMYNIAMYVDDKLEGYNITINETYISLIREYHNGLLHGKYISWDYNGKLNKYSIYTDNTANGPSHQWNDDGNYSTEVEYKLNIMSGKFKQFYNHKLDTYEYYTQTEYGHTKYVYDPVKDKEEWEKADTTEYADSLYAIWNQNFGAVPKETDYESDYQEEEIPLSRKRSYVEMAEHDEPELDALPPTPKRQKTNAAASGGTPGNSRAISGF
jgi:antitoxin component YwqK of YwqJK toxin-antitoxin module